MVYPEVQSRTAIQSIGAFLSWVMTAGKEEEITVPHHESMQKKCLHIYLEKYNKILCLYELSMELNITRVAEEIVCIFKQLFTQQTYHQVSDTWTAKDLPEVCEPT